MKKVIAIVGPTGSGKTKLSIELAKYLNTEIINGDSVQVYKELNIGSAKILEEEKEGIKHHLLSIKNVGESYTVYDFQKDARNLIEKIELPLIVGGSGLYIKSALYNYEFSPYTTKDIQVSIGEMIETIKKLDPNLNLDWQNERRVRSAYKLVIHGDKRSEKNKHDEPIYDLFLIYLDIDRSVLKERLIYRLDQMIEKGFIEETQTLIEHELNIIGYRELKSYLLGEITLEEAKDKIIKTSMSFAKKQKTWFKNQMHPKMYNALDPNLLDVVIRDLKQFLEE